MKATLPRLRVFVFTLLALGLVSAAAAATPFHFGLVKSLPADKATVHHVPEVKLWFTEAPEEGTVSINVVDAQGELVPTADVAQDPENAAAFSAKLIGTLPAGAYSVRWRGMGDDGHVVRGELTFSIAVH